MDAREELYHHNVKKAGKRRAEALEVPPAERGEFTEKYIEKPSKLAVAKAFKKFADWHHFHRRAARHFGLRLAATKDETQRAELLAARRRGYEGAWSALAEEERNER